MPTAKERVKRLNEILEMLKNNGGKSTFGKLYGEMALKYGVSKKTFWSYLEALEYAGKIKYPKIYLSGREHEIEISLV